MTVVPQQAPTQASPNPASIKILVTGTPAPQGSKKAIPIKRGGIFTGRVAVVESSKERVDSWRAAVKDAARNCESIPSYGAVPLRGPVSLSITFALARPKDHFGRGANSHLVRPGAPIFPQGRPDLSKLIRSTEDALTEAGIWSDDSQVTCIVAEKVYVGHYAGRLLVPGALIFITASAVPR